MIKHFQYKCTCFSVNYIFTYLTFISHIRCIWTCSYQIEVWFSSKTISRSSLNPLWCACNKLFKLGAKLTIYVSEVNWRKLICLPYLSMEVDHRTSSSPKRRSNKALSLVSSFLHCVIPKLDWQSITTYAPNLFILNYLQKSLDQSRDHMSLTWSMFKETLSQDYQDKVSRNVNVHSIKQKFSSTMYMF